MPAPTGGELPRDRPNVAVQEETYGGYDCEFIEPPPNVFQTKCPVCHLILRSPYGAMCCGYSFCYTCVQRVQKNNSPCPWCRREEFEVKPNKGWRLSLNQLHVYCSYSIDGCTWRGELGHLKDHLDQYDHSGESLQYEYVATISRLLY